MARTPDLVTIGLQDLLLLLYYRWSCAKGSVGDLGILCCDDLISKINLQSEIVITPMQLADLIHHMKEAIYEGEPLVKVEFKDRNYNRIMKNLKKWAPELFKTLPTGEVVMVELEDRVVFGDEK